MPVQQKSLDQVQTFPQLVAWLRDELEWPLESDNYEDISWEYDAEELGLKKDEAAKIDYIRQLRPMTDKQPFGIFFVKFNKGKLPVVALRRILSSLVVKRRESANSADRPAWEKNDLLFLSSWGEAELRQMNFAHFADNDSRKDLPTLKVLDWGQHNTTLHVREVEKQLQQNLFWPEDPADSETWRKTWRGAFRLRHRETIDTSKALSIRLAELARAIRDRIGDALAIETDKGPLTTLLKAFQQGLVHDLDSDGFADMYAQTIAYGLLSARIADPKKKTADDFAAHMRTSPFLRELMETFLAVGGRKGKAGGPGIDFDELGVSEVVELLDEANMEAVVRDFGDRNRQEDPVIHFYELFLHEYNKQLKVQRGVFYTPQAVVSYIVRSVHELLQTEFGLVDGLADTTTWGEMLKKHKDLHLPPLTDEPGEKRTISPDEPFVQILDPATGTATFLVEVIDVIHQTMTAKWRNDGTGKNKIDRMWNDYVPRHLLPRLHAYELMMAPYAIAHMKVGLKLAETGYHFGIEERARIYLTNALEPWQKQLTLPDFAALAHEAAAVNKIKRDKRFTVVIGNPPYSKSSQNQGDWIDGIMEEYKRTVRTAETQIQALSDDYSKFLRLGHFALESTGLGILSFITNNSWLDGPLFRDMRNSMMDHFHSIRLVNLHGDSRKQFTPPEGSSDENVFDIQQGVSISVLSRNTSGQTPPIVEYGELWGSREERYAALLTETPTQSDFQKLQPTPKFFLFIPVAKDLEDEFNCGWHLYDVFGSGNQDADNHEAYGAGFVTQQDKFAVGFSKDDIANNVAEFLNQSTDDKALWEQFSFCSTNQWDFERAKRELKGVNIRDATRRCLYRPFDFRFTVFDRNICTIIRKRITEQFEHRNVGLLTTRRVTRLPYNNVFVSNTFTEYKVASHDRNTIVFPLWIYPDKEKNGGDFFDETVRLNLNPAFLRTFALQLKAKPNDVDGIPSGQTPEDIFHYIYAVFHSPGYRDRYAEFLKIDFPRLPLTGNLELFRALASLGAVLTALHLLEAPKLNNPITIFTGKNPIVAKVGWTPDNGGTVWLDGKGTAKNFQPGTSGFQPVPGEVWNFHIGGYQVCEKWLKDRGPKKGKPGRTLSQDDIAHYHKIIIALTETIRIMAEIDVVIEQHGGWPDAFATQPDDLRKVAEDETGYQP